MSKGVQTQRGREAAAGRCSRRSPLRRAAGADPSARARTPRCGTDPSVRAGQSALPARARPGATPVRGRSARRRRPLATGASVPHTRTAFADRADEPTAGEAARAGFSRGRLRPAHVPWARRSLGGQSPRHAAPWVLDLTPLRPVPCWASLGVSAGKTGNDALGARNRIGTRAVRTLGSACRSGTSRAQVCERGQPSGAVAT